MANEADIIILKGAPASGKSQTAKSLTQYFPKGVKVEVDTLRQMVIGVDWTNQEEHINLLKLSAGLAHDFLRLGFKPVIIVDTFSGDKITKYLETLNRFDRPLAIKIFGLFVTEEVLKKRLEFRSNGEFKDFGICKKLNDDVLKLKHKQENQIDTSKLGPMETAQKIYQILGASQSA